MQFKISKNLSINLHEAVNNLQEDVHSLEKTISYYEKHLEYLDMELYNLRERVRHKKQGNFYPYVRNIRKNR